MLPTLNLKTGLIAAASLAHAANALTVYTSLPGSIPTQFLGPDGQYTGLPAFDPVQQTAPAPPAATAAPITITLPTGNVPGLNAKQHRPDYVGISLEMSVSDRVMGRNGTFLNPIFLNHLQNLRARSGNVAIRVGGNSQEQATIIPAWAPLVGPTINKTANPVQVPGFTSSPLLTVSEDLLYAMNNISALVGAEWYFGLPFLNEQEIPTVIEDVTSILGANLLGFQMANEPDLYESHGKKPAPYQIPEYMADWQRVKTTYASGSTNLIAPNVCCSWSIDELLAAGLLTQFGPSLAAVSVQHYKDNACPNAIAPVTPQAAFLTYQTHASVQNFWNPYINASQVINAAGKEFIMLETNTASCGGFAGASDSFAAGLYLIDLALQGASIGIAQILLHNGGVGQTYNLFTPPPNNMSTFRQWTTSAPYYSALVMSEVMQEDGSQVMDLLLGGNSTNTPGYAIYKNGQPTKLALFNYISDPSGAHDVQFNFPSSQPSVIVKRFSSSTGSTADKFNLTWAGQTMGDQFGSDGRLQGQEQTDTVQCTGGTCTVTVKAPQFALVFLDNQDAIDPGLSTQTWATSVTTKLGGIAIVAPSILATSNGRGGAQEAFNVGGTSSGSKNYVSGAQRRVLVSGGLAGVVAMIVGAWAVLGR